MQIVELPVEKVYPRLDARPVNKGALEELVSSIREIGIINPIRVRLAKRTVSGRLDDVYEISAGRHRYEAALRLNMETVPCIVSEEGDLHAELIMIDENLMRAEVQGAERAKVTARRKEIYETLYPETKHEAFKGNRYTNLDVAKNATTNNVAERFTAATAKALGRSERAVQLDAERGERIAPDVLDQIAGTHLDKNRYLDDIKRLPKDEQRLRVVRDLTDPDAAAEIARRQEEDLKTKHAAAEALAERIVCNFPPDEIDAATADAFKCGALHLGRALARLTGRAFDERASA